MRKVRDLTAAQFRAACARNGWTPQGFLGYYKLRGSNVSVSILNAGNNRRAQLAYLHAEQDRVERPALFSDESEGTSA